MARERGQGGSTKTSKASSTVEYLFIRAALTYNQMFAKKDLETIDDKI